MNTLMLQQKQLWLSYPLTKLFPVHGRHNRGLFKTGIGEGISCLWVHPNLLAQSSSGHIWQQRWGFARCKSYRCRWSSHQCWLVSLCNKTTFRTRSYCDKNENGGINIISLKIKDKDSKAVKEKCTHFPPNEVRRHYAQRMSTPRHIWKEGMKSQLLSGLCCCLRQFLHHQGTTLVNRHTGCGRGSPPFILYQFVQKDVGRRSF